MLSLMMVDEDVLLFSFLILPLSSPPFLGMISFFFDMMTMMIAKMMATPSQMDVLSDVVR